jgi:hypothetical protein
MGLAKRATIYVGRPIYRTFFEQPLWWFLSKVKAFFFTETAERLLIMEHKLDRLEKLGNIDERLRNAEVINAAQWDALEQLLLAMFRQRESRISDSGREDSTPQYTPICDATGSDRVNGPNALR